MTPRTFFTILIKIMGIYLVLASVSVIPGFLGSMAMLMKAPHSDAVAEIATAAFSYVLIFCLFFLILRYCVYKTDWLIDKLALDKHFTEEKIGLDIDPFTIVQIAIIIIGGVFFVDALPAFVKELYKYFSQQRLADLVTVDKNPGWLTFYLMKLGISYVLLTKSRWLTSLVKQETKKGTSE